MNTLFIATNNLETATPVPGGHVEPNLMGVLIFYPEDRSAPALYHPADPYSTEHEELMTIYGFVHVVNGAVRYVNRLWRMRLGELQVAEVENPTRNDWVEVTGEMALTWAERRFLGLAAWTAIMANTWYSGVEAGSKLG